MIHNVKASCFATLADLAGFEKAKAEGLSDQQAFARGDNGIGCWGDKTAQTYKPMVAIPPDDMIAEFGGIPDAKHREVLVVHEGKSVVAIIADRMPWKKDITNGCGIDMNPATIVALGFGQNEQIEIPVSWGKVEEASKA